METIEYVLSVTKSLVNARGGNPNLVTAQSNFFTDLDMDSLGILELLNSVETMYRLEVLSKLDLAVNSSPEKLSTWIDSQLRK